MTDFTMTDYSIQPLVTDKYSQIFRPLFDIKLVFLLGFINNMSAFAAADVLLEHRVSVMVVIASMLLRLQAVTQTPDPSPILTPSRPSIEAS